MLMRGGPTLNSKEKTVLQLFRALSAEQQETVAAFMAFLGGRQEQPVAPELTEPAAIPRPEQESVIKAIKRLRATYPMLDQNKLLNDTSQQMTAHLIHGKPTVEVIDELEIMFSSHYQRYREAMENREEKDTPPPPQSASEA